MLVSHNAKICVTPNANPQREQVEYMSRWVSKAKFLRWPCTFHFLCVDFIRVGSRFSAEYGIQISDFQMIIWIHFIGTWLLFPAIPAPSLINCIYGVVVSSQNVADKAQHIATRDSGSEKSQNVNSFMAQKCALVRWLSVALTWPWPNISLGTVSRTPGLLNIEP